MTTTIGWYLEDQVIVMKTVGAFKPDDYRKGAELLYEIYDASDAQLIHLIVDSSDLDSLPRINDMTTIKTHPKTGKVYVVGASNRVLDFVSTVAGQILKLNLKFVSEFKQAHDQLSHLLPDLNGEACCREIAVLYEIKDGEVLETLT